MTLVATTVTLVVFATARDRTPAGHRRRATRRMAHLPVSTYTPNALFVIAHCGEQGDVLATAEFDSLEHAAHASPWPLCDTCRLRAT